MNPPTSRGSLLSTVLRAFRCFNAAAFAALAFFYFASYCLPGLMTAQLVLVPTVIHAPAR